MDNYYGNICYCRRCNGVVHTIKKGDTLYLISKYYKVPIGEIMNSNRNINIYNLQIGDEICIPVRRPEPVESDNAQMIMPETEGMMSEENVMNDRSGRTGFMNDTGMDESDRMQSMSIASEEFSENDKLSDVFGRSNMTVGEFARLIRKFDTP